MLADARGASADRAAASLDIALTLARHPYLIPGAENEFVVRACNTEGYRSSRGVRPVYRPPGVAPMEPLTHWDGVVGKAE